MQLRKILKKPQAVGIKENFWDRNNMVLKWFKCARWKKFLFSDARRKALEIH